MNYVSFTPKQKIELYELNNMNSNRKTQESYANRGKILGAKWGKYIGRVTVYKICL